MSKLNDSLIECIHTIVHRFIAQSRAGSSDHWFCEQCHQEFFMGERSIREEYSEDFMTEKQKIIELLYAALLAEREFASSLLNESIAFLAKNENFKKKSKERLDNAIINSKYAEAMEAYNNYKITIN